MDNSRTSNVKRNILWGNVSNIALMLVSFLCRTIFIYKIGVEYLGISGLLTNVLGMLSFSELGIGTAINFSLYKPIAEGNNEQIKSLLQLYKMAHRLIAAIITVCGIVLFPFLGYLVNTEISIYQIQIFYWIFLFNTVTSYFVTYKLTYVIALQKEYIVTNINTVGQIAVYAAQMAFMYIIPSYLAYILVQMVMGLIQKIITVKYINMKYPLVAEKDVKALDKETKEDIWKRVKALTIHKFGEISVSQTDNIIISMFVDTFTVGLISNYTTLNYMVARFTNTIFGSFTASLGNLIAGGNLKKQREIFTICDFIGFWVYGFVSIAFITLSQSFITLWLGKEMLVDDLTVILYFMAIYLAGQAFTVYNFKVAAGKFNEDKWVAFVQAIVNLAVSIVAVKLIGLPGVFVGTVAQRLIVTVFRTWVVYKNVLRQNPVRYYLNFLLRGVLLTVICIGMRLLSKFIIKEVTILSFSILAVLTAIIPNILILVIYYPSGMIKKVYEKLVKGKE